MLRNYFKASIRNILRNKGYTFINVAGLTVGLATSIFIFLWVVDEFRYDGFHENGDRIFKVMRNATYSDGKIVTTQSEPQPLAAALQEEIPEIEYTLRLSWNQGLLFRFDDKAFYENGFYGDATIFKMFTFPITRGNAANPLPDPSSIAISEKLASKYFNGKDPIGQILRVDQKYDFKVSSVFADIPRNSELYFDYVIPFEVWLKNNDWAKYWNNSGMQIFASLKSGADISTVNRKMEGMIKKNCDQCNETAFLFPYTKLRLYGDFANGKSIGGRIDYVLALGTVAAIIMIIGCINFMNLATARASTRSREVGVRKVIGAQRSGIIVQFISESLLLSFIALLFSLGIVQSCLQFFNEITDKSIQLNFAEPVFLTGVLGMTVLTGVIAGSYPALFLSAFKPAAILKGSSQSVLSTGRLRKTLVVIQFVASVVLIIGSIVAYNQMSFIQNRHLGFDKENIIMLDQFNGVYQNQETFKNELLKHPSIKKVGISGHNPFNVRHNTDDPTWPGKPDGLKIQFNVLQCDHDFIPTMNMTIIEGRNFLGSQDTSNFVINEQAMKIMGISEENIIGTNLSMWGKKGKIIGVVKDFNNSNLHNAIAPLIFVYNPKNTWRVFVKVEGDLQSAIDHMKTTQLKYDPEYPFEYSILDQEFNKEYRNEQVIGQLSRSFTLVAVVISCLGLFGLSSFTAERRIKELGIRKIMGASVANLIILLCRDFTKLVLIGLTLGCPIAWYLANEYLSGYAFHTELSAWIFVITAACVLFIALTTVVYQSARAATTNPVNTLRSE